MLPCTPFPQRDPKPRWTRACGHSPRPWGHKPHRDQRQPPAMPVITARLARPPFVAACEKPALAEPTQVLSDGSWGRTGPSPRGVGDEGSRRRSRGHRWAPVGRALRAMPRQWDAPVRRHRSTQTLESCAPTGSMIANLPTEFCDRDQRLRRQRPIQRSALPVSGLCPPRDRP